MEPERTHQFYIDGRWVEPSTGDTIDVVNPATEEPIATIAMGGPGDVDAAVGAARAAFQTYSRTTVEQRSDLLARIIRGYEARMDDFVATLIREMGAPDGLARNAQAPFGLGPLVSARKALDSYRWEEELDAGRVVREPIGVCGLITPWNWPLVLIASKVGPAIAAGCTVVLKPSEVAPLNAILFAEVMHEAGVPPGVFNMVQGDGPTVGVAISSHPGIDMVSFTGSRRGGVSVAQEAAPTVKRVVQELGGKSPNLILDGAAFSDLVARDTYHLCGNTGQNCQAPTRMLVPASRMEEAAAAAVATMERVRVGDPTDPETEVGPVVSEAQFARVQGYIQKGIDEGATLRTGGLGRPAGLTRGYFVKPTVFADVDNDMTIAREEIFGPVLSLIPYADEDEAVEIANRTEYGLAAYVSSDDPEHAAEVGRRIRAGNVYLNGCHGDMGAPFGGYKQSGNGREGGRWGLEEYLETKALLSRGG
jgi:aldehyde dehydrogenase (NAD+)